MSYIEHIHTLNRYSMSGFRPWRIGTHQVGYLRHAFADQLRQWPEVFQVFPDRVELAQHLDSFETRSEAVAGVIAQLRKGGIIDRHHGEAYPVAARYGDPALLCIDRASVAWFGTRAYGQHLNGYVRTDDGLSMWLGRRSRSKPSFPGMLDQLVAGGLPHGIPATDNLAKECWEEAAIPATMAGNAIAVGCVSYCLETSAGLKPDLLFNYDLELDADFQPRAIDGEMEDFILMPLAEVAALVNTSNKFKANCNLVIIDFLIRHGYIDAKHPDYVELNQGLRSRI